MSNAGEYVEKLDHSYSTGENEKWYCALENSLSVSFESKHELTYYLAIVFAGIPREMELMFIEKAIHYS